MDAANGITHYPTHLLSSLARPTGRSILLECGDFYSNVEISIQQHAGLPAAHPIKGQRGCGVEANAAGPSTLEHNWISMHVSTYASTAAAFWGLTCGSVATGFAWGSHLAVMRV
jgi:hypothetical protein